MKDILVTKNAVNLEALDADLKTALGSIVTGVSTGPYGVQVHFTDAVTAAQENQARSIVQSHDPEKLTPNQQSALNHTTKLNQARADYGATALDLAALKGQPSFIQQMAQKIAWLELEIKELRGGGTA